MHMADAFISPAVGGVMLAAAAGAAVYSTKKIHDDPDEKKIPMMGVMGAFVFAAQMINFSIPGTGSSGHIGGGMLLAAMLGPYAGYLTMACVLLIQALFFADGGFLAYGCNVFNLGFYTCFIAYPYIFRRFTLKGINTGRIFGASMLSAVAALQLGAFSVVLQTALSGRTELPFRTFVLFMQPIHLAIGIVEGLVTAAVVSFVWKARPEIIGRASSGETIGGAAVKNVLTVLLISAIITGGVFSWFASSDPDGLEWSAGKTAGTEELEASSGIHAILAGIQQKLAFLPDYSFRSNEVKGETKTAADSGVGEPAGEGNAEAMPVVNAQTSVSGILGALLVLLTAGLTGLTVGLAKKRRKRASD